MTNRFPPDHDPGETLRTTQGGAVRTRAVQRLLRGDEPRLRLGEVLGRGAMGLVREATQTSLQRTVAVKETLDPAVESVANLLQEAWVAGLLDHPNIVPVHDIVVRHGRPRVVMKKIDGQVWSDFINDPDAVRQSFGRSDALAWNLQVLVSVCNAMEYAHALGILHRDLKPSNVLIGRFGEVWVADWGIAVTLEERHADRIPLAHEVTMMSGTPAYMAPEMATGDGPSLSERTDIYLLGAVLHRVLTGRPPHHGSDMEAVYKCVFEPTVVDPALPLADLTMRCLAKEPAARPASVRELREAVEEHLRNAGIRALEQRAAAKLTALIEGCGDGTDRLELYDLYGACRFGFDECLALNPELESALEGLRAATVAMVRYELDAGDDRAAQLLLNALDPVPDGLAEEVATLRRHRESEKRRLERLEADVDGRTAWFARLGAMISISAVWVLMPVLTNLIGLRSGYGREIGMSLATFGFTLFFLGVLTPWLVQSRTNRLMSACILIAPALAVLVNFGGWLAGLPSEVPATFEVFGYFSVALFASLFGEIRLLPSALAFLGAFLLAMADLGSVLTWLTVACVVLAANIALVFAIEAVRAQSPP